MTDDGITLDSPSNDLTLVDGSVRINGDGYVYSAPNVDYFTYGDRQDRGSEYHYGYEYHDGTEDHCGLERHFGEVHEGLYTVTVDSAGYPDPWSGFTFMVACGGGNRVLSGGYTGGPSGSFATASGPNSTGTGWLVTLESTSGSLSFSGAGTVAYAVCSKSLE